MARKSLLEKGVCQSGHEIKSEEDLYITPYHDTRQGHRVDIRCKACQVSRSRIVSRKKRGSPIDAPVRPYIKSNKPKPKPIEWSWMPS